jgi:hypothetical protein
MKSIDLTQVTTLVLMAFTVSFFVNANDSEIELNQQPSALVQDQFVVSSLETDKDGSLSEEEVKASDNKLLAKSFAEIDGDGNGLLSKEELVAFVETAKIESEKNELFKS